ncbi:MAG TPA: nucleotidyltransferase domain-containing protein [Terriglobales bacterium]|nr:nucleotidyltransferase domain-containing protein [Terriglobales bacterium]
MSEHPNVPEKTIADFVGRLCRAAGSNLVTVILYGSAVTSEFDPKLSDINLLCIVRDTSYPALEALAPVVKSWVKRRHAPPLILGQQELLRFADVLVIEFLDIKAKHRVLYGDDMIASLAVSMRVHRVQLEYELRVKGFLLHQQLMLNAGDRRQTWNVLQRSLPTFATLFRHLLVVKGQPEPLTKRDTITAVAALAGFDPSGFLEVLDVREHKSDMRNKDLQSSAARYLAAVEQATAAVDRMLESNRAQSL